MAIIGAGYGYGQEGGGLSTITMSVPVATASGDIMLCAICQTGGQPAPTFPAGWTTWDDVSWSGDRFTVKWKRAAANEPSFDVSNITALNTVGMIAIYRGCKATGDPASAHSLTTGTATTTVSFPSVATGAAGAMVHLMAFVDSTSATMSTPTGADPTVVENPQGFFSGDDMWDALSATGNPTGARTSDVTGAGASATCGWSLALTNPSPGAGPTYPQLERSTRGVNRGVAMGVG